MANTLVTNPIVVDTTDATLWTDTKYVQQMQWINDAGDDIAATSTLIITSTGALISLAVSDLTSLTTVAWEVGPFAKPMPMTNVGVTISHGTLLIWLA